MLDAAFGSWIRTLEEREFDEPFAALLRASGFHDIHFTHGNFELGKDFVAKLRGPTPTQYAFQCKAGDVAGGEWDRMFAQLYQLAGPGLAHPSVDSSLPRACVLVTTGRLTGKAVLSASQFGDDLRAQGRRFEVWDNSKLREILRGADAPEIPPSRELLPILARVASGAFEEQEMEALLAGLLPPADADTQRLHRAFLDNALVSEALAAGGRPFHALTGALNAVRIAASRAHVFPEDAGLIGDSLRSYTVMGRRLLAPFLNSPEDTKLWLASAGGVTGRILAYPAICLRVVEFLGLAALSDAENRGAWVDTLQRVVKSQPGASRPISDRFAASLAPAVIALALHGDPGVAATLLRRTAKWLCDRYERSKFGLADAYASAKEEAETLLGAPLAFVDLKERSDSLLAVAVADLAYVFAPDLYEVIINDVLAVGIHSAVVDPLDVPDGYRVGTGAIRTLVNVAYPDRVSAEPLRHHRRPTPRVVECLGVPAALLGIACLTRDRLFSDCYPGLAARRTLS